MSGYALQLLPATPVGNLDSADPQDPGRHRRHLRPWSDNSIYLPLSDKMVIDFPTHPMQFPPRAITQYIVHFRTEWYSIPQLILCIFRLPPERQRAIHVPAAIVACQSHNVWLQRPSHYVAWEADLETFQDVFDSSSPQSTHTENVPENPRYR